MSEPVEYFVLSANSPDRYRRRGSWADVLEDIPYLLLPRAPVPPRHVVNEVLRTGERAAGMSGGCVWKPVELDEDEYNEVVEQLLAQPAKQYQRLDPPPWVETEEDYGYWKVEVSRGVPAEENRAYVRRLISLPEQRNDAEQRGDHALAEALRREYDELAREHQDFFARYDRWKADPPPGITM